MLIRITLAMGGRTVPIEQISDARIAIPLKDAARQVGRTLEEIRCPVHKETASNVRVHFDAGGKADLQYDSCCDRLGKLIGDTLG